MSGGLQNVVGEQKWQEGSAATNLSSLHERLFLWMVSMGAWYLSIWVQCLRRLLELMAVGFWVSRCGEWEQCIEAFRRCGLVAQRTEWTQRDLTSKASPEVPVGSMMMCIEDRAWDSCRVVNPVWGTRIYTQRSDVLIFVWVNHLRSRIRVLCVDVFREWLEWGVVQIRTSGGSDLVGSVRSPWLVVSVFLHTSLSNSLPLFWWHSNVIDQAAQKTEYYLGYYIWGGGDKQASSNYKITGIHKSSSTPGRFPQLMSTDMSLKDSMIQMGSKGIFTRTLWIIWSIKLGLLVQLQLTLSFFPKINIAASENRHVGRNSLSMCLLVVPNIFIKKQFPDNRATLALMPWLFLLKNCGLWETFSNSHLAIK